MAYDMRNDLQETLVSKEEIAATVARLGAEISRDYEGKNPILITVPCHYRALHHGLYECVQLWQWFHHQRYRPYP